MFTVHFFAIIKIICVIMLICKNISGLRLMNGLNEGSDHVLSLSLHVFEFLLEIIFNPQKSLKSTANEELTN